MARGCPSRPGANDGAAGVSQPQGLGDLVEGLAHGIVDRLAQHLVAAPVPHVHEHRVATRDEARHEGRLEVGGLEQVGKEVALEVVDANKRQVGGAGEALGERDAHHKGAHQARTLSHANGRKVRRQ